MIKKIFIAVTVLFCGSIYAQEGTASPYSYYGIGELKFKGVAENRAMGGISVYNDSIHVNLNNPSAFGFLRYATYTVGASYNSYNFKTNNNKENASAGSLDYLALGFPISKKMGLGFGLMPFTSVGYKLQSEGLIGENKMFDRFSGSGGMNKAFLSWGYQVFKGFSIGATANYDFGKMENEKLKIIENVENATLETNRSELSGFDFNLAASYKGRITDKLQMQAYVSYIPEAKISSDNFRTIAVGRFSQTGFVPVDLDEIDLEALGMKSTDLTLPSEASFGFGVGSDKKWFLGADYKTSKTGNFANPFLTVSGLTYEDSKTFSVGGFYLPKYNSFSSYFSRVVYRAGMRFENTGMVINGETINDFGISFGIGLPIGGFSNANIGFDLGKRGTTNSGLVQENYFNVRVGLSLNDRWFVKSKYQ